jgi:3-hydroxyisobutyrate dehydrogenase
MAFNLLKAGFSLTVYNRTRSRAGRVVAAGAAQVDSPGDVARLSDVVCLMVTDREAVRAVCDGPHGVLANAEAGTIVLDFSTIGPEATLELARDASQRHVAWLDAPVTGGDVGAQQGTLTIMVGGEEAAFNQVLPLLRSVGERIVYVGGSGFGQSLKLVANLVSGLNLMAAAEGLRLGLRAGIAFDVLAEVLPASSARSFEVDKLLDRWRAQMFEPGFSVANRTKDMGLALEMAESLGFATVLAPAAHAAWRDALTVASDADETAVARRWDDTQGS